MNVRLEQLDSQLKQGIKPVYMVSGDEPLLVQEASEMIRRAALAAHFHDREVLHVDPQFKWEELFSASNDLSLFATQKIIELRLQTIKLGNDGSKALQGSAANPSANNLLLISSPKLDKNSKNAKWFKVLDQIGVHIEVWPVELKQLPQWIDRRMRQAGLKAEREAVSLLAELMDGNLLAAAQEIEKLKLLVPADNSNITVDIIRQSVADSSRYNIFNLIDSALIGDSKHCIKILAGLRDEGVEALTVVWALSREIRQLSQIAYDTEQGRSLEQAMQTHRIWRNRQPLIAKALSHLPLNTLHQLTCETAFADQLAKGMHRGNLWDQLERITLILAGSLAVSR